MPWSRFTKPFTSGLLSARPAAGSEGRVYYATDDTILYTDDGSAWRPAGMQLLDTQTFTSSTTYSISSSAKILVAEIWGAGAGGGGASSAGSFDLGGNGGAGGVLFTRVWSTQQISGSVTVTIGAGGTGGTGGTGTAGAGGAGGNTRFGSEYFPGSSGAFPLGALYTDYSAKENTPGGGGDLSYKTGGKGLLCGGGGGCGGAQSSVAGSAGGSFETIPTDVFTTSGSRVVARGGGGTGPITAGAAGGAGGAKAGGGSGAGHGSGAGGNGGAGGAPSGGGGGGGRGTTSGGAGGAGGRAEIKLWVYG